MLKRRRLYRTIEGLLLRLGGLIVLLLILRPQWGHPGDFYLGYPNRFYITQSDVACPYVSVLWFLWDVILCGTPVFVVIFLVLCGVRRSPFFNHQKIATFRSDSGVTRRVLSWRPSSTQLFFAVLVCVFIVGLFVPS